MKVTLGRGKTEFGRGVDIILSGDEVAIAIDAYLVAHKVYVSGPRSVMVNEKLCVDGRVYVDPSGSVISENELINGNSKG